MAVFTEQFVLAVVAATTAGMAGVCFALAWSRNRIAAQRRRRARQEFQPKQARGKNQAEHVVTYAVDISHRLALGATRPILRGAGVSWAQRWLAIHAKKAGITDRISPAGLVETMARLGFAAAGVGALIGVVFSIELSVLGALGGAVGGALAPTRSILRLKQQRSLGLERDLSEMLEVVALGLHSGLSFDRSFGLYGSHFDTPFAQSCTNVRRAWTFGLTTREEALRDLADSYESALLARVIENIVRSLRFGSSLAEGLESAAVEARAAHRAHVEERVAKAPVKMMLPTGALILPAMLLLVLGPVLLELMEGF